MYRRVSSRNLPIFGLEDASLLKNMFGDAQMSTLADYIQAALMLRYNKRTVG